VEVLTSANQTPSKDWLNFVISSKARNKIRSHLRAEQREKSLQMGKDLLLHELLKRGMEYEALCRTGQIEKLVKGGKESSVDELFIAIGYGQVNPKDLLTRTFPPAEDASRARLMPGSVPMEAPASAPQKSSKKNISGVLVSGLDNILVTFGRCCSPLPGESVIGFITRGRGVSIHRDNCPRALDLDPARRVDVRWSDPTLARDTHNAYLRVVTQDRQGILAEITLAISGCGANIKKAQVRVSPTMMGILDFELDIHNLDQLHRVIQKIEAVPNVVFVERKTGGV
jgi:guanosine-3',5'-bis(diphosphate) 3'-pyrophosphohydrolase